MEATVKRTFIDSQQDDKDFQINDKWKGSKDRFDEINLIIPGALVEIEGGTKAKPSAVKDEQTKERKTKTETK